MPLPGALPLLRVDAAAASDAGRMWVRCAVRMMMRMVEELQ